MNFNEYLKNKEITLMQAAKDLGLPYEYIRRYAKGLIIPNKENMQKIVTYTSGEVQPNDFYGVANESN